MFFSLKSLQKYQFEADDEERRKHKAAFWVMACVCFGCLTSVLFLVMKQKQTDDKWQDVPSAFRPLVRKKQPKYQFIHSTADSSRNNINHISGTDTMPPPGFYISGSFKCFHADAPDWWHVCCFINTSTGSGGSFWDDYTQDLLFLGLSFSCQRVFIVSWTIASWINSRYFS